ncbi:ribonuclease Z [Clostridium novyi A str. 4552]|uniref:Ribonuclease Z n=1 Tax=Clostridium novyi A str. 4552 TaxID=1444289 RepID=A0A0A0IBB4_CLONO|nr:ribonuclease Z [Clostridium novyi]KGM97808.1 ribonuclease Z [Clostridium novyi A str. 4552]
MIDVLFLGTGGGAPTSRRNLSSVILKFKGRKILVDCGEGTQLSMKIAKTGFKDIDIICISHCHGDHIIGFPGILSTIGNSGRTDPLTIIGPRDIIRVVKGLTVITPYLPYELNIIENPVAQLSFNIIKENLKLESDGELLINTLEVNHSIPCIAYNFIIKRKAKFNSEKAVRENIPKKLWSILQKGQCVNYEGKLYSPNMVLGEEREGIKISFVTDTTPIDSLIPFIEGSDMLICEGTYGKDDDIDKAIKNKHMTFSQAATLAYRGHVKELILTHFGVAMENPEEFIGFARNIFENSYVGKDRMIKSLKFN